MNVTSGFMPASSDLAQEIIEIGAGLTRTVYETNAYVANVSVKFKVTKVEIDAVWLERYVNERVLKAIDQEVQKALAKLREYSDEQVEKLARGVLGAEAAAILSPDAPTKFLGLDVATGTALDEIAKKVGIHRLRRARHGEEFGSEPDMDLRARARAAYERMDPSRRPR